jgi:hypothetical protein
MQSSDGHAHCEATQHTGAGADHPSATEWICSFQVQGEPNSASDKAGAQKPKSISNPLVAWARQWIGVKFLGDPTAVFAFFVALFTLALVIIGKWQADRLRETVEHARTSSEHELRAYVAVAPMGVAQLIGRTDAIGQVQLSNVGHLPARKVSLSVRMEVSPRTRAEFEVIGDTDQRDRVIQAGGDMRQGSRDYIDIRSMIAMKQPVFVWGVAYYDDGFGKRRFTRFCHRYGVSSHNRGVTWSTKPSKTRLVFDADKARYHTEGNDAD